MAGEFINQTDEEIEANLASKTAAIAAKQPLSGNSYAVAGLPDASANSGRVLYCSDGDAGSPCGVISDGTNWKVIGTLGDTVATE